MAVTLLGWLTLIKGVALMATSPRALATFYRALHYPARFRLYMAVALAFSAWLTVTAFLTWTVGPSTPPQAAAIAKRANAGTAFEPVFFMIAAR